jgi:hypothetical protein
MNTPELHRQVELDTTTEINELKDQCERNAESYSWWAKLYSFSNSMSTFVVVIGGLFMAAVVQMTEPGVSKPVVTAMSIAISILKSMQQVFKWPDKGLDYKKISMKYRAISRKIQKMMVGTRLNRVEPEKLVEKLTEFYVEVDRIDLDTFKYSLSSESTEGKVLSKSSARFSPIMGSQILRTGMTPVRTAFEPITPSNPGDEMVVTDTILERKPHRFIRSDPVSIDYIDAHLGHDNGKSFSQLVRSTPVLDTNLSITV